MVKRVAKFSALNKTVTVFCNLYSDETCGNCGGSLDWLLSVSKKDHRHFVISVCCGKSFNNYPTDVWLLYKAWQRALI